MNMRRKLLILGFAAVAMSLPGHAQTEPPAASTEGVGFILAPVPPATKLEGVLARKNSVIQKSFTEVGVITGEDGAAIRVLAVQFHDLRQASEYGVAIEVHQSRGAERTAVAYVDEDEIDSLAAAIETLGRMDRTGFNDFEGVYRSRGSLEVENQSEDGSRFMALRATEVHALTGRVVWATARYRVASLAEMGRLLANAKATLAQAKAPKTEEENK